MKQSVTASASLYFIAIVLPADLDSIILKYKQEVFDKYGCRVGLRSPAHITLQAPFWMSEEKESALINSLSELSAIPAFPLETNDFSCFAPRTIYISVKPCRQLEALKQSTDLYYRHHDEFPVHPEERPFQPHITIATRDLRKKDFADAWEHFSKMEFRKTWTADNLTLLRHDQKKWEVKATSLFKSV